MVRWPEDEARLSRQRRASAVGGTQGNGGRGGQQEERNAGGGGGNRSRRETAVEESRKETADRVARHQADYNSEWNMPVLLVPPTAPRSVSSVLFSFVHFFFLRSDTP